MVFNHSFYKQFGHFEAIFLKKLIAIIGTINIITSIIKFIQNQTHILIKTWRE